MATYNIFYLAEIWNQITLCFSIDSKTINNFVANLGSDTTKHIQKSNRFYAIFLVTIATPFSYLIPHLKKFKP